MRIRWTPIALNDLKTISGYIERQRNLANANRVCRLIYDAVQLLRRFLLHWMLERLREDGPGAGAGGGSFTGCPLVTSAGSRPDPIFLDDKCVRLFVD